jgi:hypothetical protein
MLSENPPPRPVWTDGFVSSWMMIWVFDGLFVEIEEAFFKSRTRCFQRISEKQ